MKAILSATDSQFRQPCLATLRAGVSGGVSGLLAHIQENPGQRVVEMASTFAVTQRTIERWLKQLKDSQLIEFRGAPKTGGYYRKENT